MPDLFLPIAGGLIVLLGAGCALGAYTLWNGAPASWTDVVAGPPVVRRTARVLAVVALLLIVSAATCFLKLTWAAKLGAVATLVFVVGGFVGNCAVFGNVRPAHTIPNVLIAAVILWMLWRG